VALAASSVTATRLSAGRSKSSVMSADRTGMVPVIRSGPKSTSKLTVEAAASSR
jgi:hypothetical protein